MAEIDLRDFWLRLFASLTLTATCWFGGYETIGVTFFATNVALNVLLSRNAGNILRSDEGSKAGLLFYHYILSFFMMLNYALTPVAIIGSEEWLVTVYTVLWLTGILMHAAMNTSAVGSYFWIQMLPAMVAYAVCMIAVVLHPSNGANPVVGGAILIGGGALLYSAVDLLRRRRKILDALSEARRQVEAQLAETRRQARTDALTGLPNRSAFEEYLTARLETLDAPTLAVSLVDLNGFKAVNDQFGHDAGDAVLMGVGRSIRAALGDQGLVARLGGDEFALIFFDCPTRDEARVLGAAVAAAAAAPIGFQGRMLSVGASLGVVLLAEDVKQSVSSLLRAADLAMYAAKRGRGPVEVYDPASFAAVGMECAEAATAENGALPLYALKADLTSDHILGLAASPHWTDRHGATHPFNMLDESMDPGRRTAVLRRLLTAIERDAKTLRALGRRFGPVALRLPVAALSEDEFLILQDAIDRLGGLTASLMVEASEGALFSRSAAIKLGRLKAMGALIAVEEFGAGFATPRHLETIPLDQLKIHPELVVDVAHDDRARRILDGHLAMGERLGVEMVADGVATQAQRAALTVLGFQIGQGPLFGAAAPADTLADPAPERASQSVMA